MKKLITILFSITILSITSQVQPDFRGIYIDNAQDIVGNQFKEDSLLRWCTKNKLNEITLYGSLVGNTKNSILSSFIGKAFGLYGINTSLISSNTLTAISEYKYYKTYPNKFNSIVTEYEFWNKGYSYTIFKDQLKYLKSINDSSKGLIKRYVYLSKFIDAENIVTDEATIAQRVVGNCDKILLVNYTNDSYKISSTIITKLKRLALTSYQLNKTIDIIILFNINNNKLIDPNIYDYFATNKGNHQFIDAYNNFKSGFDKENISHKSNIKLVGFQLYRYSNAKLARP